MRKAYFGLLFTIYILALIVSCGIRVYLTLTGGIDSVTGLYSRENTWVVVFNMTLLVAILLWSLMTLFRRTEHEYPLQFSSGIASLFSVLTGLAILGCAFADINGFLASISFGTVPAPQTSFFLSSAPSPLASRLLIIKIVLAVLAALGMILLAVKRDIGKAAFLGIFPALWQLVVILERYIAYMSPTQISDNLLSILFMTFAAVFLLGQARSICGFKQRHSRNILIPTGFATSLTGFAYSLPKLVSAASNIGFPQSYWEIAFTLYAFVLAIYSLAYVTGYTRAIKIV